MAKDRTHVFVVRLWQEPREIEGAPPEWRGMIEHVSSGDRRYFRELEDITSIIPTYIELMLDEDTEVERPR